MTPGPWIVDADTECAVVGPDGTLVADCEIFAFDGDTDLRPIEMQRANARLIAATPDLLEALQDIIEQAAFTRYLIGADLADSIHVIGAAAVAKATGARP